MTATGRDYREALTRMSNGDLLRAYGQAVLDNDGPGSRGFFQQQSIALELLRRMESYENLSSLASPQYLGHSGECRVEKRKGADPHTHESAPPEPWNAVDRQGWSRDEQAHIEALMAQYGLSPADAIQEHMNP